VLPGGAEIAFRRCRFRGEGQLAEPCTPFILEPPRGLFGGRLLLHAFSSLAFVPFPCAHFLLGPLLLRGLEGRFGNGVGDRVRSSAAGLLRHR
jgi:hypothetical protein